MRKLKLFGVGLLTGLLFAGCQSEQVGVGARVDVQSRYVFRDVDYSKGPIEQPGIDLEYRGLKTAVFVNVDSREVNEHHLVLEKEFLNRCLTGGYEHIWFPQDGKEAEQAYATAKSEIPFRPSLTIAEDLKKGGIWSAVSVEKQIGSLASTNLSFSHNHKYYRDGSGFGRAEISLSKSFRIGPLNITAYLTHAEPLNIFFDREDYGGLSIEIKPSKQQYQ